MGKETADPKTGRKDMEETSKKQTQPGILPGKTPIRLNARNRSHQKLFRKRLGRHRISERAGLEAVEPCAVGSRERLEYDTMRFP